jgi:hypothetical protein
MAKIGMSALFNKAQIANVFNQFIEQVDQKVLETYQFVGETFVDKARSNDTYKNRTNNLRNSIGYIILKDGKILDKNFKTSSGAGVGKKQGESFANSLVELYPKGWVLIGVAGMEYAAYVEKKHHLDVISGSVPESNELRSILDEIKF